MADSTDDRAKIQEEIKAQGTIVRQLKAEKAPKEKVWTTGFFCTGRKVFACSSAAYFLPGTCVVCLQFSRNKRIKW